jgi:hypothetical protein
MPLQKVDDRPKEIWIVRISSCLRDGENQLPVQPPQYLPLPLPRLPLHPHGGPGVLPAAQSPLPPSIRRRSMLLPQARRHHRLGDHLLPRDLAMVQVLAVASGAEAHQTPLGNRPRPVAGAQNPVMLQAAAAAAAHRPELVAGASNHALPPRYFPALL